MKLWRKFKRAMLRIEINGYLRELKQIEKFPRIGQDGEAMMIGCNLAAARKHLRAEEQYEIDLATQSHIRRIRL